MSEKSLVYIIFIILQGPNTCPVFCPGFQKGRVPSEKGTLAR